MRDVDKNSKSGYKRAHIPYGEHTALESERLAIGEKTKELETLTTQLAKQKDQIMQLESNHQGVLREIASIKESESLHGSRWRVLTLNADSSFGLRYLTAKTKQSQVLEEHLNKDERDLARIVELLGLDVQHVGESKPRVHWLSH